MTFLRLYWEIDVHNLIRICLCQLSTEAQSTESDGKQDITAQQDASTPKKTSSYVQNGLKKMFELFVGIKETPKAGSDEQSKTDGKNDKQAATVQRNKVQDLQLISTREMMSRLTNTKEKVEKHVSNLLLSAFGEQLIFSQGKNYIEKT